MWSFLARLILRNRLAFLITLGGITLFMAWNASKVQLSYELGRMLPDTEKDLVEYKIFKETFGEDGAVLVIGIEPSNLFSLDIFNDWYELGDAIKKTDGIEEVVSLARCYHIVKNDSIQRLDFKPILTSKPKTQEELDSLKKIILSLPPYEGLLYSTKSNATLMAVTLNKAKLNTKSRLTLVDSIKSAADRFGEKHALQMHYSGLPYIRTAISRKVAYELLLFIVLALGVTSGILLIFFRSFKAMFFSILVVLIGVIWSFGSIVLMGYKISILIGLIPPLIIVIGVPNCILLLNKYHTEYQRHGNKIKALSRMIERIGMTTFLANVTTAIGFGVFYFTHTKMLMEFGLIASMNVMATYVISLILIPILFSFLAEPDVRHIKHLKGKNINRILKKIDFIVHHNRKMVYSLVIIIVLLSLYGMTKINSVGFIVDDLPKKDPIYTDLKFFEEKICPVMPFEISIDTKKKNGVISDNGKVLYKIKNLQKSLLEFPEFSKPVSVVEALKFAYQGYKDGNPKYFVLPSPTELKKLSDFISNSPQQKGNVFKTFIDSTKQTTRISIQMVDVGSVRMKEILSELRPKVDSIFNPEDYHVVLTGNSVIFATGNEYLLTNLKESVILALVLICGIMIMLFMSVRMITVSVLPSIIPLLMTAGLMGFCAIALKPSSILIFSIAFGIASDGTIYFLTKYRQEIKNRHFSISKAVSVTIEETGVSMVYTAIILFAGFGIFAASSFGGTQALGILVSLTLLIAYCSNLILLPAILLSLEKRLITKAFLSEPLIQVYDEDDDIDLDELEIKKEESLPLSTEK